MTSDKLPDGLTLTDTITVLRRARRFNWSRDGNMLAIPTDTGIGGEIAIWSTAERNVQDIVDCHGIPTSVDCCIQGGDLAYGTQSGSLTIFKPRRMGSVDQRSIAIHTDTISQVEWSPDGELLATASHDQTICVLSRASEFRAVRRIQTTRDRHNAIRWSPTGREIAVCGTYYGVQLFQAETGNRIWEADRSTNLNFHDLAWSPRVGGEIAVALSDGRIWLVSPSNGGRVHELEGHKDSVISLAFSSDGRILFSLGLDNCVRIWDASTFAALGEFSSIVDDRKYCPSIACHPTEPLIAAPGPQPSRVQFLTFDSTRLRSVPAIPGARFRTRVKVALVGQSEVGKTQVAQRLCGQDYSPGDTTHGVCITCIPALSLDPNLEGEKWKDREILLWDLGGQKDYQLIHQLFLHDTTLALVMCDPTRRDVAYHDVETWVNKLHQQSRGGRVAKILVGTKVDNDIGLILSNEVSNLCERLNIGTYIPTSAKHGTGIAELGSAILTAVDWDRLERVVRPDLFQLTRDKIEELRVSGEIVVTVPALIELLKREHVDKICDARGEVDVGAVNVVVTQLSLHGIIAETRLADTTRALVLQIAEIERYAGSLLVMASDNSDGIPAIDELSLLGARAFPGIAADQRLPRDQERIVLEAVVQLLLQNGLCLRHEGMLVFPSKVTSTTDEELPSGFEELFQHIDFHGAVENIYATLITSLSNGRSFGRLRLRPGRVEFVGRGSSICSVACINAGPGRAKLRAFASNTTSSADRTLFYSYIQEHFARLGVELHEQFQIKCACGGVLSNQILRARIDRGESDIPCPICELRHDLSEMMQHGLNIDSKVAASRIRAEAEDRAKEMSELTGRVLAAGELRSRGTVLNILHISDLHITEKTEATALLVPLAMDIEAQGTTRLDYIVISGDITNRAGRSEFEKAYEFVSALLERFSVTAARIIIVPGNHDVDWDAKVYDWRSKRTVSEKDLEAGYYTEEGSGYLIRLHDKYPERFRNFSERFFHLLKLNEYPLEPRRQYFVDTFLDDKIQFLSFNSSARIDEFNRGRSDLNYAAVSEALQEAHKQAARSQDIVRIGVFHHPATGDERIADNGYLGLLQQAGVGVCLHGHVHEERAELFNYLHPNRVHIVGAGTLGALADARPESTPRQYNLLQVDTATRTVRVHTRAAPKATGAWGEWCVWPTASSGGKQGWYEIQLPRSDEVTQAGESRDEVARRILKGRGGA